MGSLGTTKGYTGQFHDAVSGLDYYHARYDDPVVGQFLSVDSVQGNAQRMNPYQYVEENPETYTDPTGHCFFCIALPFLAAAVDVVAGVAAAAVAVVTVPVVIMVALVIVIAVLAVLIVHQALLN